MEAAMRRRLRASLPKRDDTLPVLELPRSRVVRQRSALDRLVARSASVHVFEVGFSDAAGRVADSTLVAVLGPVDESVAAEAAATSLRGEGVRGCRARVVARLTARWLAIRAAASLPPAAIQPALFDGRALEEARAGAAARDTLWNEIGSRLDRLEKSDTITADSPRLLLVARVRV
jgi:hypothetical protein